MGRIGLILGGRLAQALAVALLVGGLSFLLVRLLPGDMALRIAAGRYGPDGVTGAAAEMVRQELGLDRPWLWQFGEWIGNLLRLDLGYSLVSGQPVIDELWIQLGYSCQLAAAALLMSLLIGPPIGLLAGLRPGSLVDGLSLAGAAMFRALPAFVVGLGLIYIFSIALGLFPPAGFGSLRDLFLPAFTLALGLAAMSSRVTREAVAGVVASPYYRFAQTKGLGPRPLLTRHGLRNAAVPVVAYLGLQFIYLIEGVVVVESLFAYPGIGHALVHAIIARDVPLIQGTALLMGFGFVLLNAMTDLITHYLDPRARRDAA